MKQHSSYQGIHTKEISFPLGGIGSGCIGLAGNGRLIDWEIFNRPNKRSFNGFSHIAVKAESQGRVVDCRVLQGDLQPGYVGQPVRGGWHHSGYGFGPDSNTMAGMPHFRDCVFVGEFPIARVDFADERFPGEVSLTAFNPFIPLNDHDSSLPAAFFEIEVKNPAPEAMDYSVCFSVSNPLATERIENTFVREGHLSQIKLTSSQFDETDTDFGDLTLATDCSEVSFQEYWYRGSWCDNLEVFWNDISAPGPLKNRQYSVDERPSERYRDTASLAAHFSLNPGETKRVRFALAWNYPNVSNTWNPPASNVPNHWKNYYATVFQDSSNTARYALENWSRLLEKTTAFKDALFSSSMPDVVVEAISANLSVLKSPVCLRLTDGSFYAFEGAMEDVGACEGSCSHVWNYAYALPFLFPKLERSMRDLDFRFNQREDGRMQFRLQLPLGREPQDFRACVDGQFGGVLKCYREWKICGDDAWLRSVWPHLKKCITYAWAETNEDRWDADRDGVLEGRQHHTLDMELFGPNSWMNGFYLAALKAAAEIATYLCETETAQEFHELFRRGKKWTDKNLFNGQYYVQKTDLNDQRLLEPYVDGTSIFGDDIMTAYWNSEAGEIKYQVGEGCAIDQVCAQWHANLIGLGEVFDTEQTRIALKSLYTNNYIRNLRDVANTWRIFSLNDEGGMVVCSWPEGQRRPKVPLTYSTETQSGYEYQVAAQLLQNGFWEEAETVVRSIRNRYDGEKRNPWSEIECGSNYARSMASYSLLLAYSGFRFDSGRKLLGFNPVECKGAEFRSFWCLNSAWGNIVKSDQGVRLDVLWGSLPLKCLQLPFLAGQAVVLRHNGHRIQVVNSEGALFFEERLVKSGDDFFVETIAAGIPSGLVP